MCDTEGVKNGYVCGEVSFAGEKERENGAGSVHCSVDDERLLYVRGQR